MRADSTVAIQIGQVALAPAGMVPRLNLGRVEECAARRAGTPRGEKKLGLRIESDVSLREM